MVASLWQYPDPDFLGKLANCLDETLTDGSPGEVHVYFRADDIAVPSARLARLMELFITHDTPLALAVVPAWLTPTRWQTLRRWGEAASDLWCWHQHGWRHQNHAPYGKKAEFGDHRPPATIAKELNQGFRRLTEILDDAVYPLFTPPWNRMGPQTLQVLAASDLTALSRDAGQQQQLPTHLPEIPVHVDLHTIKEKSPELAGRRVLAAMHSALTQGRCGIMLHHQQMNPAAFEFLDYLLTKLKHYPAVDRVSFPDEISRIKDLSVSERVICTARDFEY